MPRCEFPTFAAYLIEMTDLGFLDQWDCCSRCFVDIDQVHPDHHMVAIRQADDYIRGKDQYKEYHPNVRCDRESAPFRISLSSQRADPNPEYRLRSARSGRPLQVRSSRLPGL